MKKYYDILSYKDGLIIIDKKAKINEDNLVYSEVYLKILKMNKRDISLNEGGYTGWIKIISATSSLNLDLPVLPKHSYNNIIEPDKELTYLKESGRLDYLMLSKQPENEQITFNSGFFWGYKAAQSKGQYNEDDLKNLLIYHAEQYPKLKNESIEQILKWFIQSLSKSKTPKGVWLSIEQKCNWKFDGCKGDSNCCECSEKLKLTPNNEVIVIEWVY